MARKRSGSEWRSVFPRPAASAAGDNTVVDFSKRYRRRKGSSGALNPWKADGWSINPQSFSVVSSPSLQQNTFPSAHSYGGQERGFSRGLSVFKLGAIFFGILSIFLFGTLVSLLLR
ncbi:MAG: hypothetical protein K1X83_01795 [Oligoflexia bacterium]|nr:hypothetical protein [Oligoflexia bacterium]